MFIFFRISEFWNRNSDFSIFQQRNSIKFFPTGIFGIGNGSGIPLPMGVLEIRTKNWNSQPRFLGGLRHSPPRMKNQRGSMREKTIGKKIIPLIACDVTRGVSLDTNNQV